MHIVKTLAILATTALPAFAVAATDVNTIAAFAAPQGAITDIARGDQDRRDHDNPTPWLSAQADQNDRRDGDNPTPWLSAQADQNDRRDGDNPTPWLNA